MSFWLPQNLQKRLLLYAVQQISVFSNVDLSNLHVSLGSSSQFTFDDLELAVDSINVPGFEVKSGTVGHLDLELTVSGGVAVRGKGIIFELRPEASDQGPAFSLAKSIHDLTNSIILFPDVNSETGSTNDLPEGSSLAGVASSSSISSSGEDDVGRGMGTLESMRNKLLNVALSKLKLTFDNTRVRIALEDNTTIELCLGAIDFQTEKNSARKISVRDFRISHSKTDSSKNGTQGGVDTMSKSIILQTHIEESSLYMSAMENSRHDPSQAAVEEKEIQFDLLVLDCLDITFEGLSTIDDLSVENFVIQLRNIDLKLQNILNLDDSIFEILIKAVQRRDQSELSQTTSLAGYKRFQREQHGVSESTDLCSIELLQINIEVADCVRFALKNVNYNLQQTGQQALSINSIELNEDNLSLAPASIPIVRANLTSSDSGLLIVLQSISLNLDLQILRAIVSTSCRVQDVIQLVRKKCSARRHARTGDENESKVIVRSEPLYISLKLDNIALHLSTGSISSDLVRSLFETKFIKIDHLRSNKKSTLIYCRNISIISPRSRVQINSYDDNFNDAMLTSKIVCKLEKVYLEEDFEDLTLLHSELHNITLIFASDSDENGATTSKASMKRSVRILQSSSVMHKHTELAAFALIIDSTSLTVKNFMKEHFGSLELSCGNIVVALTEDDGIIAFCKKLACARQVSGESESVIEPVRLDSEEKPLLYFYQKSGGKIKVRVRNLSFFYHAKWLGILRTTKASSKQEKTEERTIEKPWEIKLVDSAIILRPYRLKAALAVVVDNSTCSGKSYAPQIKNIIKSGSLLLIDDYSNLKSPQEKDWASLSSFYAHQGFSAIGRFETLNARVNKVDLTISLKIKIQSIGLSLCADSAHTLTQLCMDLKYPLTFPDEQKYNCSKVGPVDVFENVDNEFFDSLHIQEEAEFPEDNEIVDIDDNQGWNTDERSAESSSYKSNSRSLELQEAYLDLSQETRTNSPEEESAAIDIALEFEAEDLVIKLFDGYDWKFTRRAISRTIDQVDQEIKAFNEEPSNASGELAMTVFDSIFVSANATDTVDLKKRVNDEVQGEVKSSVYVRKANLHPSRHYKMAVHLEKINLHFTGFSEEVEQTKLKTDPEQLNKADITVQRLEIIDNVPTSTWNKFLTWLRNGHWASDRAMLHFTLTTFRPMSCLMATELALNVEVAPLRLHVDQTALDFLVKFSEFKDTRFELIDDYRDIPFIQKLTTNSVKLKLDYKPKKVDYSGLRSGHASELMNFFILDGSNVTLKGVELYGINGFPELNTALKAIWTPDITSKQLPGVLEGFAPMKSLLALGSGVKALVSTPPDDFKEDRRLGKGLKNGCNVFVRTTTGDFVRLGAKLASGTQTVLENAEQMLGGDGSNGRMYRPEEPALDMHHLLEEDQLVGGSNPQVKGHRPAALVLDPSQGDEGEPKIVSLYADQPLDIHKGLEEAYYSLEKHMHVVYDVVWKTKGEIRESKAGRAAAAVSVAKVAPVAVIRPLIGATEAVAKALQGISNQFDKEQIDDINDKYKSLKPRK